jgi:N-acetylglucosaminyl-diphospho-decaprenol L-rhamnosyltransferase
VKSAGAQYAAGEANATGAGRLDGGVRSDGQASSIDVVIVTARGSMALVQGCLRSLQAHPPSRARLTIHVIDNASRDGTVESIRSAGSGVSVVELPDNRGFAAACNVGIRMTTGPFVLLLNPDTVVRASALDRLLQSLEANPDAAAVGPRLIGVDGRADHNAKRAFPSPAGALAHFVPPLAGIRGGLPSYHRADIPGLGAGTVDAVSGSCMLVRRRAIPDAGLLDEGYWMYGEDLDWCRRFAASGWQVRYDGSACVVHVKHGVTGRHRTLRTNWAFHRAMGRFYRRFDAGRRPWLDAAVFAAIVARFCLSAPYNAVLRRARSAMRTPPC